MKFKKTLTTTTLFLFIFSYFFIFSYEYSLGQDTISNNFFVDSNFDFAGRDKVTSTMYYESDNAYFYLDNLSYGGLTASERIKLTEALTSLGNEFDARIYPTLRSVYGAEWSPGIDNDSKITILITRTTQGVMGYFLERNELTRSQDIASNEREMIYLSSEVLFNDSAKVHLAHEFVHLIEYNQRIRLRNIPQKQWLSEGLADYAITLLGYNTPFRDSYLQDRTNDFLAFPSDSLINWNSKPIDFATSSMFMHYLIGQYGEGVISKIMNSPTVGEQAVMDAVNISNFRDIFTNWTVANFVNGSTKKSSRNYAYATNGLNFSNLHISTPLQYSIFSNSEISTNFFIEYASASWLKFVPGRLGESSKNILVIDFGSSHSGGEFEVPYVLTDIFGVSEVRFIDIVNGKGMAYVNNFGTSILSVVVIPSNYYVTPSNKLSAGSFTIKVSMSDTNQPIDNGGNVKGVSQFKDGSLLRAIGDSKVYVIKNPLAGSGQVPTKRWIPSADIFNGYGHLKWSDIIDVQAQTLNEFQESKLIKFIGDYKVYEVSSDASLKQWLNITPAQFEARGRNWNAIYEVNQKEYDYYTTGTPLNA